MLIRHLGFFVVRKIEGSLFDVQSRNPSALRDKKAPVKPEPFGMIWNASSRTLRFRSRRARASNDGASGRERVHDGIRGAIPCVDGGDDAEANAPGDG